ncbi:hypothetical protein PR048_020964 [Dryococelus australis]|uniref:DDE Tnp4 domain-containing protein n=1 Tax=Dryococelus australis TaxID=614101 RepID=A0ABQ9GWY5_9NEOP|nr:hypothetical protein PR048_020964 [Dryococelus australis]
MTLVRLVCAVHKVKWPMLSSKILQWWPGSVHDGRVLQNVTLNERMHEGWTSSSCYHLGSLWLSFERVVDSPAIPALQDRAVNRFNRAHKSARRLVENSFGVLNEKFPCLKHLWLFAAQVFKYCTALCNIARNENIAQPVLMQEYDDDKEAGMDDNERHEHPAGQQRLTQSIEIGGTIYEL